MFSRAVRPPASWRRADRLGPRLVVGQRAAARAAPRGRLALTSLVAPRPRSPPGIAGEPGFEPGFTVLETVRIAVNSLPRGELREQTLGAAGYFFFFFFFAVTLNVVVFVDVLPAASRAVIVRR